MGLRSHCVPNIISVLPKMMGKQRESYTLKIFHIQQKSDIMTADFLMCSETISRETLTEQNGWPAWSLWKTLSLAKCNLHSHFFNGSGISMPTICFHLRLVLDPEKLSVAMLRQTSQGGSEFTNPLVEQMNHLVEEGESSGWRRWII